MARTKKKARATPTEMALPVAVEVIRFTLGEHTKIAVKGLSVVVGACIVPAPGQEASNMGGPAANRAWVAMNNASAVVLVDEQEFLLAEDACDVVATDAGNAQPWRSSVVDPVVLTPREEGVRVEAFIVRGRKQVTSPKGWEVWVYVAR